jgi:hypothetical protein
MLDWQVSRAALARSIGVLDSSLLSLAADQKARKP